MPSFITAIPIITTVVTTTTAPTIDSNTVPIVSSMTQSFEVVLPTSTLSETEEPSIPNNVTSSIVNPEMRQSDSGP